MYRIILKLFIVLSIVSPSLPQNSYRKYNVDQESFKLYGEDFKSVLKRFRRTPEYLKILEDKLIDMKNSAHDMSLQVLHYYRSKMEERVIKILPTTETVSTSPSPTEVPKENVYFYAHGNRRQEEPTTEAVEESWQKVKNLDSYKMFESSLSVAERNSLVDLGFEFAGKIIHSIIDNMAPKSATGATDQFTRIPDELSEEKTEHITTTMHPKEHAVRHGTHKEDVPKTEEYPFRAFKAPPKMNPESSPPNNEAQIKNKEKEK